MSANQIYSQLKDKQFRAAFDSSRQWWEELRWEMRLAAVGLLGFLLLAWIFSSAGAVAGLLVLPLGIGALIAAARPTPLLARVDGFALWANNKRQRAAAKGTFFSKWAARPFYASLGGSANLTAGLGDSYLRAGATVALQGYAIYLALLVTYVAVYIMLALICLAVVLWILAYAFSDSSGGGRTVGRAVSWGMSRRSEQREDILGRQYTQHYDDQYNQTGRTETREDILGRSYRQHISPEGHNAGHSEQREDILGNPYTQHFNDQGDQGGYSEEREDMFGRKYIQHFDKEGNAAGRSEESEDIFGRKYTKHDEG